MTPETSPGWTTNPEYQCETEIVPATVRAEFNGKAIAESDRTLLLMELGHGPVYYIPRDGVAWDYLTPTQHSSYCQYKGFASYWTLTVGDRTEENAVWGYEKPYAETAGLKGHVGLYWHKMDGWFEGGRKVEAPRDIAGRCDARHSFRALYPELAREWHPTKNPNIWPYECAPWFRAVVWWKDEAGNEWQQPIRDRVLGKPAPVARAA